MKFLKQLFCKHEFQWHVEHKGVFQCISGEIRVLMCDKCKKIKNRVFWRYAGNGFK